VIPRLSEIYDEPFADSSQLPTYLVAALARKHVTVALSGDGGDEVFGGYNRYVWLQRVWKSSTRFPLPLRRAVAGAIAGISVGTWDALYRTASPLFPKRWRQRLPGEKLHKIAGVMNATDPRAMYSGLASHWQQPEIVVTGTGEPVTVVRNGDASSSTKDIVEQMMYLDSISYLPDDILVKLDRATMAVSLEARVPILDHRVIEFACRLPLS